MKPDKTKIKPISSNHSIEIGKSTWDPAETSIRNRYNSKSGKFSPRGSSELPLEDLPKILEAAAEHDLLDIKVCAAIIENLAQSIKRQK